MNSAGYYRFPTIHDDTVVFVSEDDLWTVPADGGIARRLTSNQGAATYPQFSPDGAWIAFVGREEGAPDVYVMPADGGPQRRLTFLASAMRIVGWNAAGTHILFATSYGQMTSREMALFQVAVASRNGQIEALPYGLARSLSVGPDGGIVLGRNTNDPARQKRYRGGKAGRLWIDVDGTGDFTRFLADLSGNITSPMWLSVNDRDRIFFVSDHEGVGNLYSCLADESDLRRHTDHGDYYVRHPASDGQRIVYHAGADLFIYPLGAGGTRKLEIDYRSPRIQRARKFVYAGRYVDNASLHPAGQALAVNARGKAFAFFNFDGPVLQLGERDGIRYRLADWLNDGHRLVMVSDAPGEEVLEIHDSRPGAAVTRLDGLDIGRAVRLRVSPKEDKVAIANHRHELLIVDLAEPESDRVLTLVDRSPYRRIAGFDWSPDGRWLAYGFSASPQTTEIRLFRVGEEDEDEAKAEAEADDEAANPVRVTQPVLHDVQPAFDPAGRYLYFLSEREFNPVYDGLHFDLGFPWGTRPYLITLQADLPNPFVPHPERAGFDDVEEETEEDEDDAVEAGDGDDAGDDVAPDPDEEPNMLSMKRDVGSQFESTPVHESAPSASHDKTPETNADRAESAGNGEETAADDTDGDPSADALHIDLEGIEERIFAFPVHDGRYGGIRGVKDKALFTEFPIRGTLDGAAVDDDEDSPDEGALRAYDFKEFKCETLAEDVRWFDLSRDGRKLLYGVGGRLRVINAGEKPPSGGGHPRKTGWINLGRVKVSIDPPREWEQMYREAWRLQRDHFWTADMSQVDWQEIYRRYFPLLERISSRREFSDLMWEMQGELGTSHAYEFGGDYRPRPYYTQGRLAASFVWDAGAEGYRITEIVRGDPWDRRATSPLSEAALKVRVGDVLRAVNGQPLDADVGPDQLLVNLAEEEVLLTLADASTGSAQGDDASTGSAQGDDASTGSAQGDDASTGSAQGDDASTGSAQVDDALTGSAQGDDASTGSAQGDDASTGSAQGDDASTGSVREAQVEADASAGSGQAGSAQEAKEEGVTAKPMRSVVVRTLGSEEPARYRAWVDANRRRVHAASDGRVGYVHIPDMGPTGYAEFHRGYLAEIDRDGLIIDVRYNAGGHVSQLILEKLARRRIGYDLSRWGGMVPYPLESAAGPLVALANEHAASDGDVFCHSFKLMKLGPLIGQRTWGGVIGIYPRHPLVDGTVTTQPEFSLWFEDVGWHVENYGTAPDIAVEISPQDYVRGRDPQLERAIEESLRLLAETPILKPDLTTRPNLALPTLPQRSSTDDSEG